jgi:methionyl-tRNA formyltransferase
MRYILLGSPPFAVPVLESLLESGHTALALVTRPDRPRGRGREVQPSALVQLAQVRGLSVLQPTSVREEGFVERLRELAPQVLLVASYGEILREDLLQLAPLGAFNVHGSLLPRWRGASPIQAAIGAGDEETGVSVQRMVKALDEGDVLLERRTPIGREETAGELFERLARLGGTAAVEALDQLDAGSARCTPQDPSAASYAPKLKKQDGRLDWTRSSAELGRFVRSVTPWPAAQASTKDGAAFVILAARTVEAARSGEPGELLETDPRCVVACGSGALELITVKPAGKRAMDASAWLRGTRLAVGSCLSFA